MGDVLKNIRRIRKSKNISQADIASFLNIEDSTYSKIERGITELTLSKLKKISEFLDTSLIDLLSNNDENKQQPVPPSHTHPKVYLQIELSEDKKDQVMKLIFGNNNLEILNK